MKPQGERYSQRSSLPLDRPAQREGGADAVRERPKIVSVQGHENAREGCEEGGARLFRRARHQRHPQMAPDHLPLRGGDLHRRPRPGRGARPGARQGPAARYPRGEHLRGRPARGIRPRLRVPDVPRQRALRRPVPARHLHRPAADRQAPDRDRRGHRRRRRGPWRDRQGQRPGAIRAGLLRPEAGGEGDRPLAGMGPRQPHRADRLRRAAPDPDRQGQARRGALLRGRQPAALLFRGEDPGRALGRAGRDGVAAHHPPRGRAGPRHRDHRRVRARRSRWASTASASRPPRC